MPSSHKSADERIAIIGLGYVGLPLGVELIDEAGMYGLDLVIPTIPHDAILEGCNVWERIFGDGIPVDIEPRLRNTPFPDIWNTGASSI